MFTYELKANIVNGYVSKKVFMKEFNYKSSPQITYMKYDPYNNNFHIVTNDDMDEYFKVVV